MAAPRDPALRAGRGFMLRTPLLPLSTLVEWAAVGPDVAASRRFLAALLDRREVREALFVASPSLYDALEAWRLDPDSNAGQRAEASVVKYVTRMAGRATPFGLCSGVSAGALAPRTALELDALTDYQRRTRIDNDFLFAAVGAIARTPEARSAVRHRVNDSLYRVGGTLRYAQARLVDKERSYHLVSAEPTPYLEATLARARAPVMTAELATALVNDDAEVTTDEAQAYVEQLIDAHILVPELGVTITGREPLDAVLDRLAAAGLDQHRAPLAAARDQLAALDAGGLGHDAERYRAIAGGLETLPAKVELARLFQVDMVKPARATLATQVVAEVARTIAWLQQIARPVEQPSLEQFRRAFLDRYERRAVPLTEALDEEIGIGFEVATAPGSEGSPLLVGIPFPGTRRDAERVVFGPVEAHLQRRLAAALAAGEHEIVLGDADLERMRAPSPPALPDAMSAMIRLAGTPEQVTAGDFTVLLEDCSGPSGARLLGRFCHASAELDAIVREHLRAEEGARPDAVFAEIVHLNEGRIGNIVCRPVLREHEIVFLGISGAAPEHQIPVDDLLLSLPGETFVLTSRRLGREVIPRLSTAHNFRLRSLGIYRFLCALQNQDGAIGVGFEWGPAGVAPRLPRVRIGRTVVARAQWTLTRKDIEPLTRVMRAMNAKEGAALPSAERRARIAAAVDQLRRDAALPRFLVLAEGDNELPVDLDNPLAVQAFAAELAGSERAKLLEMFPAPDALPVRGPEGSFTNEIVLTFTRTRDAKATARSPGPPAATAVAVEHPRVRRDHAPGSQWLYAKLFTGWTTADRVLRDAVSRVVTEVRDAGHASHWFFIRYADSGPHLRLRFAGEPDRLTGAVLPALHRAVAPLVDTGAVTRVQLDTYVRELERYGGNAGIELCEQIFWIDSEAALEIVELLDGDAGADARWRLALLGAERLAAALGLDPDARGRMFAEARDSLGREHGADAAFYGRLGERFKRERESIDALLAADVSHPIVADLVPGLEILARRDERLAPVTAELAARDAAGALRPSVAGMAWSLVHMHCNRLLHASHRAHELVLYDFLRRSHEARRARTRLRTS